MATPACDTVTASGQRRQHLTPVGSNATLCGLAAYRQHELMRMFGFTVTITELPKCGSCFRQKEGRR